MLWNIPVGARSHQFIPKAWLFNAWEGRRRKEEARSWLYKHKRSHSWDISPELHLEEEKKFKEKNPTQLKPTTPPQDAALLFISLTVKKERAKLPVSSPAPPDLSISTAEKCLWAARAFQPPAGR